MTMEQLKGIRFSRTTGGPSRDVREVVASELNRIRKRTRLLTEDELGENIRTACEVLGWKFYWCRRLQHSTKGILDLQLIPMRSLERRHILNRELKGYDKRGRLGKLTAEQVETIQLTNAAGGDAGLWTPEDWFADRILGDLE